MDMLNNSLEQFSAKLASAAPTPGGGGAAALAGALAVALGNMVGSLTVGKKKYADVEDRIKELNAASEELRGKLLAQMDEDAKAFEPLSKAYGIPKDAPGRDEELERCLHAAAEPPMNILRLSCEAMDLIAEYAEKGSRLVISDAGCAAAMAEAALRGPQRGHQHPSHERPGLCGKDERRTRRSRGKVCPDGRRGIPACLWRSEMSTVLKGKPTADALDLDTSKRVETLKAKGVTPTLAILRVGEREDDLAYERGALKRAEKNGVAVKQVLLPADVTQDELLAAIRSLNEDDAVHGVLMFRPLPKHLNENEACEALAPEKDVDGITRGSMASIYSGKGAGFAPCTAESCIEILKYNNVEMSGKRAVVIGRSLVIGKPVAMLLMANNATVTVCHSRTKDMPSVVKEADIVIACLGRAEMINKDYFVPGQVVLDVGINWSEEKNKLVGDVAFDEVEPIVDAITPVPGGVGSGTTAVLIRHVVEAAEKAAL